MKRMISLALVLACLLIMAAPAYAQTATVRVGTWLTVRKEGNSSSAVIGYLKNGDTVDILEMAYDVDYVRVRGVFRSNHDWASSAVSGIVFDAGEEVQATSRIGYVLKKYLVT